MSEHKKGAEIIGLSRDAREGTRIAVKALVRLISLELMETLTIRQGF